MTASAACASCGFSLWNPVAELMVSSAGLYDDARFPGRMLVSLHRHFEQIDELPQELLLGFMSDVATAVRGLRRLDGVQRVNVAILGNREPHVHAHLVPRRAQDPNPGRAPWDGAPPRSSLDPGVRAALITDIAAVLR